jgi:hypothetical protein
LKNTQVIGIIAKVVNPSKDVAHANPRLWTICAVKRGDDDEIVKRRNVVAAKANAL